MVESETVIYVHEDLELIRELYPVVPHAEFEAAMREARAPAHEEGGDRALGWATAHMFRPDASGYADIGLRVVDVATALAPVLPRVRHFYVTAFAGIGRPKGWDSWGSYDDDAWSFGLGDHCYVKLDVKGELVEAIWFDLNSDVPTDVGSLRTALQAVDKVVPSVVVDNFIDAQFPLADAALLDRYLAFRAGQITKFRTKLT